MARCWLTYLYMHFIYRIVGVKYNIGKNDCYWLQGVAIVLMMFSQRIYPTKRVATHTFTAMPVCVYVCVCMCVCVWGGGSPLQITHPSSFQMCYAGSHMDVLLFVVVNVDALTQASDIRIERRQVVFLCWRQDSNPSGSQTPNRQQTERTWMFSWWGKATNILARCGLYCTLWY